MVPADASGQFYLPGAINRWPVLFLIDTGSTGNVALNRQLAAQLGLKVPRGGWKHRYKSANGIGKSAGVCLAEVNVAGLVWANLNAEILFNSSGPPLLGMACLRYMHLTLANGAARLSW